jgi:hypothetical protein
MQKSKCLDLHFALCIFHFSFRRRPRLARHRHDLPISERDQHFEDLVPRGKPAMAQAHVPFHGEPEFDLLGREIGARMFFLKAGIGELRHNSDMVRRW